MPRRGSTSPAPAQPPAEARPRRLLLVVGLGAAAAIVAGISWFSQPPRGRSGAVVLVSIDTLRADRLPVYGYRHGRAPATSALATDAVVFERAYAHAPQTLPSHASMMTGLLPFEHKVRDNLGFALADGATTLASLFRAKGYKTAGFASAYVLRRETGIGQGFDVYDATFPATGSNRSPAQVQRPGPDTLDAAEKWMDSLANANFFLFLHLYEPHTPYRAPDRFADLAPYDGEVAFSDEITGRVLEALRKRGWYKDATIIVLSDHGEGLGDHIEEEHGLFLYEEVVRVPWIMKLPGNVSAGRRVRDLVQHIDLYPTLAALYGLEGVPQGLRGRDLSPVLVDKGQNGENRRLAPQGIYAEALYPRYHFGWSELVSLTDERYRYIRAPREELYDLERDPAERTNVFADRSQAASALRSALDALVAGRSIDAPSAVSNEDRQRLAALGYVGTQAAAAASPDTSLPDPKDKVTLLRAYRRAVQTLGDGRFDEGARLLGEILKQDPAMTDVWAQYAAALGRLGRHQEALDAYGRMIRLQPEEPSGALGAAAMLLALNRLDEAKAHAELAIGTAPSQAHQALAIIAAAGRQDAEALRHAELAAQAEPGLPMPAFIRGTLAYNAQHYREALRHLMDARKGYAHRSEQPQDLHFMSGDALARLERYQEAEPYLQEEVRLYPQHVRARAGLAMLYQALGRQADAARALDDLVRLVPSRDATDTAARIWRMFDRPDRAAALEAESRKRAVK
jgi:arylsulfatase A-like enzyme/predicted Zn-dependent protease